jgi:hypothetical protein
VAVARPAQNTASAALLQVFGIEPLFDPGQTEDSFWFLLHGVFREQIL